MARSDHDPNTLRHPETGRPLAEAETAGVGTRFAEAGQVWRDVVTEARAVLARTPDRRHQALLTVGVQVAEQVALTAARTAPHGMSGDELDDFMIGLLVGVVACAAIDGVNALDVIDRALGTMAREGIALEGDGDG